MFIEDFPRMLPTKFRFIWPSGYREGFFQKSTNQKQELSVAAMFDNGLGRNKHLYRGPAIDASYQVSVHLAKWFQRRRFKKIGQPETRISYGSCLLMVRDKMSNLYRGPSIDASYQASLHLAEGFQRRRLKCEKLTDDGHQVMAKAYIAFGKAS